MRDYVITYDTATEKNKVVTVTDIDAAHAKATLKRVMPGIEIRSSSIVPKKKKS